MYVLLYATSPVAKSRNAIRTIAADHGLREHLPSLFVGGMTTYRHRKLTETVRETSRRLRAVSIFVVTIPDAHFTQQVVIRRY